MAYRKYDTPLAQQARQRGVSRQRMWQLQRQAEGLCATCGLPREHYAWVCDDCGKKQRKRERTRIGASPWEANRGGRKPLVQEDS